MIAPDSLICFIYHRGKITSRSSLEGFSGSILRNQYYAVPTVEGAGFVTSRYSQRSFEVLGAVKIMNGLLATLRSIKKEKDPTHEIEDHLRAIGVNLFQKDKQLTTEETQRACFLVDFLRENYEEFFLDRITAIYNGVGTILHERSDVVLIETTGRLVHRSFVVDKPEKIDETTIFKVGYSDIVIPYDSTFVITNENVPEFRDAIRAIIRTHPEHSDITKLLNKLGVAKTDDPWFDLEEVKDGLLFYEHRAMRLLFDNEFAIQRNILKTMERTS